MQSAHVAETLHSSALTQEIGDGGRALAQKQAEIGAPSRTQSDAQAGAVQEPLPHVKSSVPLRASAVQSCALVQ